MKSRRDWIKVEQHTIIYFRHSLQMNVVFPKKVVYFLMKLGRNTYPATYVSLQGKINFVPQSGLYKVGGGVRLKHIYISQMKFSNLTADLMELNVKMPARSFWSFVSPCDSCTKWQSVRPRLSSSVLSSQRFEKWFYTRSEERMRETHSKLYNLTLRSPNR